MLDTRYLNTSAFLLVLGLLAGCSNYPFSEARTQEGDYDVDLLISELGENSFPALID